jgi:hypothetical protein
MIINAAFSHISQISVLLQIWIFTVVKGENYHQFVEVEELRPAPEQREVEKLSEYG